MSRILDELKQKTGLTQWKNSYEVIKWFKNIKEKKKCSFLILDVCEYYPSITKKLLNDALNWASQIAEIKDEEKKIMLSSKKSLLFKDGSAFRKKSGGDFDVTMGSYDGAETSDIVGLFLLSEFKHLEVKLGCFRHDSLGFSRMQQDKKILLRKRFKK